MKKKIGRNDPCPCSSGKKYKKCCLASGTASNKTAPESGRTSVSRLAQTRFDQGILDNPEVLGGEMIPFSEKFPGLAYVETRCVMILEDDNDWKLPVGVYSFLESYCGDPKCDCRRVFINVGYKEKIDSGTIRMLATIGYGWDRLNYYLEWFNQSDPEILFSIEDPLVQGMQGPILELTGYYSEYSERLLRFFKESMLKDQVFVEKLKRHYRLFKALK